MKIRFSTPAYTEDACCCFKSPLYRKFKSGFVTAATLCALAASAHLAASTSSVNSDHQQSSFGFDSATAQQLLVTPTPQGRELPLSLDNLPDAPDVDLLALNDDIKATLDRHLGRIESKRELAHELHRLLFKPYYLGITYNFSKTKTAQQTFDSRTGNCLSHAALYVAAARYMGLKADFQHVHVPLDWLDKEDFYIVPGHMNVAVKLPGSTITVEFTDVFSAWDTYTMRSDRISDKHALAEYYNNIGMEHMEVGDYQTAIPYLKKSTETYKRMASAWSNLGVAYKITGHLDLAQNAYERGMRYDKRNLSLIKNVYILYKQTGQMEKADKLTRKVERYSKKNPYYLEKLANSDMALGNYEQAVKLLKKAIRYKPTEPRFHVTMSYAFFQMGHYESSIKSMALAKEHSATTEEQKRYQAKQDILRRYRAGI